MRAIRAHFDGRVIILDEPIELAPDTEVTVWVQSTPEEEARIAQQTRDYYRSMTDEEKAEDEEWAKDAEQDASSAWED